MPNKRGEYATIERAGARLRCEQKSKNGIR